MTDHYESEDSWGFGYETLIPNKGDAVYRRGWRIENTGVVGVDDASDRFELDQQIFGGPRRNGAE